MGMCIEVQATVTYTVRLTDEEVKLVKEKMEENRDPFTDKYDMILAIRELYDEGKISLYDNGKATESDFSTESIDWSEFEKREPEAILGFIKEKI